MEKWLVYNQTLSTNGRTKLEKCLSIVHGNWKTMNDYLVEEEMLWYQKRQDRKLRITLLEFVLTMPNFVEDLQGRFAEIILQFERKKGEYESFREMQREVVNSLCHLLCFESPYIDDKAIIGHLLLWVRKDFVGPPNVLLHRKLFCSYHRTVCFWWVIGL